jgi:glycosyltransferase involved in cell wall biosynthesis
MDTLRVWVAAGFAVFAVGVLVHIVWGYAQIPWLADVPPAGGETPRVSVIVAARDEERNVGQAVRALLAQSYADYEVVVVDDRSADRTPAILRELASAEPRLRVVTVKALPAGWLGKSNAMHSGAQHATGELLLFADADVVLDPLALSRAVRLFRIEQADHVTAFPGLVLPDPMLKLLVHYGFMWAFAAMRPWKTRDPNSSASLGVGAFNLVRATAYRAVGGHARIPLRPDDDLMLGLLLKRAGYRQIVAFGEGLISVEWYRTLGEAARGFRKNTFAALRYSLPLASVVLLGNLAFGVWPFVAIGLTGGVERLLYEVAALSLVAGYAGIARVQRSNPLLALLYPVAALCGVAIMAAAVLRTVRRGGIEWRGTFYSLDALRANKV